MLDGVRERDAGRVKGVAAADEAWLSDIDDGGGGVLKMDQGSVGSGVAGIVGGMIVCGMEDSKMEKSASSAHDVTAVGEEMGGFKDGDGVEVRVGGEIGGSGVDGLEVGKPSPLWHEVGSLGDGVLEGLEPNTSFN